MGRPRAERRGDVDGLGDPGDLADGGDPAPAELVSRDRPDPPQPLHRQRPAEEIALADLAAELGQAARNHGMQLEGLRYDVTPIGMHYLVIHWDIPAADETTWSVEVDGLVAGLAAAGPALEDRLQQQHDLRERQAGRGRKGFSRSSVRNPWAALTNAVWWYQPSQERPSKWSRPSSPLSCL